MERMLALGPLTSRLRVSMAGTFLRRGLCFQPATSSLSPTRAMEFSSTRNISLRFNDNRERIWQIRQLHFRLLKPRACVDVQPSNATIVKTVKARRTRVTKATENVLVLSVSTPAKTADSLLDTTTSLNLSNSAEESSDPEESSDSEGNPDSEVDESVVESETLGILNSDEEVEEVQRPLEEAAPMHDLYWCSVTAISCNICIVGIDPDASGAIAVLKSEDQDTQAEVLDVPCVKVQIGKTMRRRHDARSIVALVHQLNAPQGSVAYVEQAMPFPKDGKQGWYGTGFGYGMWVGILMASGFKVVPVRAQAWKSAMGISGRQYTKDDSRTLAMSLFPNLTPQLKRKKDHGRADALLIAAFGKGLPPITDPS